MKKSNLRTISNVYLRQPGTRLKDDRAFSRQVRGRTAIRELMKMLGVPPNNQRHDDPLVTQLVEEGKLTIAQKNALKWELPCAACNSIPCGLNFNGELEFRCPAPQCSSVEVTVAPYVIKKLVAPIAVLQQARAMDFGEALSWAIEQCHGSIPQTIEFDSPPVQITLRISSAAGAQYTERQLAAFLVYGILNFPSR
jgi:hypothetical protein